MSAPHNKRRYGETWPQERIDACLAELEKVRRHVILSGGWAWHFMSPVGHAELKHAHDHKDVDIFVLPQNVVTVIGKLMSNGFLKATTKYDGLKDNNDFRRYEKMSGKHRITIDFFVDQDLPTREVNGWKVISPEHLLSLYSSIHSSGTCFSVQAAAKLLALGVDPVGRKELVEIPA